MEWVMAREDCAGSEEFVQRDRVGSEGAGGRWLRDCWI
jgi:hypothetical protein